MDLKTRIFIGAIMIAALIYIIHAIRKKQIDIRHALVWLIAGIVLLFFDIFPSLLIGLAHLLGFELPVNMLFFLALALLTLIIFALTAKVSRMSEQIKTLMQEMAILDERQKNQEVQKDSGEPPLESK